MWKEAVVVLLMAICRIFLDTFGQTSQNLRTVRRDQQTSTLFRLC